MPELLIHCIDRRGSTAEKLLPLEGVPASKDLFECDLFSGTVDSITWRIPDPTIVIVRLPSDALSQEEFRNRAVADGWSLNDSPSVKVPYQQLVDGGGSAGPMQLPRQLLFNKFFRRHYDRPVIDHAAKRHEENDIENIQLLLGQDTITTVEGVLLHHPNRSELAKQLGESIYTLQRVMVFSGATAEEIEEWMLFVFE